MSDSLITLTMAFALGFAVEFLMFWGMRRAGWMRVAFLLLIPPALLFAAFMVFFDGTPEGGDWLWLTIGIGYFWPWYVAWGAGCIAAGVVRRFRIEPAVEVSATGSSKLD